MTSLTTTKPSQMRMMGGHILPSSSGRPRLTMARRQRSASTIFSRDLPTNVDRDPSNISTHWSHSPLDQGSRVAAGSSAEGRLPSPAPSAPHATDTDMPPDCCDLGGSSGDILLKLIEVTFRPHSPHCCSFTAVIRDGRGGRGVSFGQLARLIKSIGHIGKIDDFTIKPRQQNPFLLTGISRHASSRLSSSGTTVSIAAEVGSIHGNASRLRLQDGQSRWRRSSCMAGGLSRPPAMAIGV